jgi:dipicolinate synthase subunit A
MFKKYIFTLLGGDKRQVAIAQMILRHGHSVRVCGFGELGASISGAEMYSNAEKAINGADVLLLPLPVSRDNNTLALSHGYCDESVGLSDLVKWADHGGIKAILGGMIPDSMIKAAQDAKIYISDYYKSEKLQKKNALPSAEGALMIAMENTDRVISNMSFVVCGYGRIGAILADILSKMGADVTVMARRDEVLCEIAMQGYRAVRICEDNTDEMAMALRQCDVVFNTVPHVVFTRNIIGKIGKELLYIEVASQPGGIDVCAAREAGIEVIFAPSLPGKYAPVDAGRYIFETVFDILNERGIEI